MTDCPLALREWLCQRSLAVDSSFLGTSIHCVQVMSELQRQGFPPQEAFSGACKGRLCGISDTGKTAKKLQVKVVKTKTSPYQNGGGGFTHSACSVVGKHRMAVRLNASEICAMRPNGVRYGKDSVEDGISALC